MGNAQTIETNGYINGYADVLTQIPNLSPEQICLIRQTWRDAKAQGSHEPGTSIFQNIEKFAPDVGELFDVADPEGTRLCVHAKSLTKHMDKLVKNLENHTVVDGKIKKLGTEHVGVSEDIFKPEYWEIFAKAMMDCVKEWGDKGSDPEAQRAWTIVIAYFMTKMREGYDESSRSKKKIKD